VPTLPRLAWVAFAGGEPSVVTVFHGTSVETGPDWLVEGVWDGPFETRRFDRADHFFGSGIVCDGDCVRFVPSVALTDRLLYAESAGRLVVANSLPLLLAATGARLDPDHDYAHESLAMLAGLTDYPRDYHVLDTSGASFRQIYHERLVWQGGRVTNEPRNGRREFSSYEDYVTAVHACLDRLVANARDAGRRRPMDLLTTLSSGYDSTAVATLVRDHGVRTCFTSRRSNSSLPRWLAGNLTVDDGTPTASVLGLTTAELDVRPESVTEAELQFLAPGTAEPEIVFHSMAKSIEASGRPAVVFTGYHGDKMWDAGTSGKYLDDQVHRGDTSGLGLSEARLASGFINVAVPFLFARSVASLHRIAHSEAMAPWRLGNSYDRPIARRVAESAGVPRDLFGMRKRAVVAYYFFPRCAGLRSDYARFLREQAGLSPAFLRLHAALNTFAYRGARLVSYAQAMARRGGLASPTFALSMGTRTSFFWSHIRPPALLHRWAVDCLRSGYEAALRPVATQFHGFLGPDRPDSP